MNGRFFWRVDTQPYRQTQAGDDGYTHNKRWPFWRARLIHDVQLCALYGSSATGVIVQRGLHLTHSQSRRCLSGRTNSMLRIESVVIATYPDPAAVGELGAHRTSEPKLPSGVDCLVRF